MRLPKIIAVEGFDGTGKTTIAQYLQSEYQYKYHKSPESAFAQARELFDQPNTDLQERFAFYVGDCIRLSMYLEQPTIQRIVLDRYYFSTIAYHESKLSGISRSLLSTFYGLQQPDMVLLVKTDFDTLVTRIEERTQKSINDILFLKEELYNRIYELYEKYIHVPCVIIDNNGLLDDTIAQVQQAIQHA